MSNLADVLLSTGIGFVGTMIGAAITWLVTTKATRTQAVFKLLEEFNSEELLLSRHKVQNIKPAFYPPPGETLDTIFREFTTEERFYIWQIIHFYQKLYVAINHKSCDTKLIPELFGETFYWWYTNCFAKILIPMTERDASRRIKNLKIWFDKNSKSEDVSRWVERAEKIKIDIDAVSNI
jgi:hypothetical protein